MPRNKMTKVGVPVTAIRHNDKRVNIPTRELQDFVAENEQQPKAARYPGLLYARDLWVPAVNNHGGFGRWAFVEISDPWNAQQALRAFLEAMHHEPH